MTNVSAGLLHLRSHVWIAMVGVLLASILACGPGAEPTPTPTATAAPVATPTTAPAGPAATPTPTSVAPAAPTPTPGEQPQRGGILRYAEGTNVPNYDIHLLQVTPGYNTANAPLYLNLFVNYEGSVVECEICSEKGWRLEDGGKTMVFDIQPGIKFHSGQELIAADVIYSIRMISGDVDGIVAPRSQPVANYVKSMEAPSKYELRINLLRPAPFVPKILSVGSSAIYRQGTTRDDLKKADAGAGPFIIKERIPGAKWEVQRYPDYFKKGQPYLDGILITLVADQATQTAAFLTHSVDSTSYYLDNKQYESKLVQLESAGKIRRHLDVGGCGPSHIMVNNTKPPFNELKMRQAVNLALDRAAITNVWLGNNILPAAPQLFFYTPQAEYGTPPEKIWNVVPGWGTGAKKQQEVEQARQLVKDAGYPTGITVDQMVTGTGSGGNHEEVQQELKKVGINTVFSSVTSESRQERLTNLDYQLFSYTMCHITRDPDEVVGGYWVTGSGRNWFGYSNPEVDKLFIQMSSEQDPVKRKELFFQVQDIVVLKTVGYMPIPTYNGLGWHWSNLHNVKVGLSLHSGSGLRRADRIWMEKP